MHQKGKTQWFRRVTERVHKKRFIDVCSQNNTKSEGADLIVNEVMRYGGEAKLTMMVKLYNSISKTKHAPRRWRETVVVNFLNKGYKACSGNYRDG